MTIQSATKLIAGCALLVRAGGTFGHELHGMPAFHGHAADALFLLAAAGGLVALAAWLARSRK